LLKKQNWSVAKAHEAGNNNANIMSQVCFKLCEDVLFNLCKFRLIRLEAVNYEALVAFWKVVYCRTQWCGIQFRYVS